MTDHTTALDAIAEQLQRIADALSTPADAPSGYQPTGVRPEPTTAPDTPSPIAADRGLSRLSRFLDALTHSGPGYDLTSPAADEDEQRTTRRQSLHNLIDRLDRRRVHTWEEAALIRQHIEAETRDVDRLERNYATVADWYNAATERADKAEQHAEQARHERDRSDEAARRALEQRQEMAKERYAWQQRGDRAEAAIERVRALEDRLWTIDDQQTRPVAAVCHEIANDLRHTHDGTEQRAQEPGAVCTVTVTVHAPTAENAASWAETIRDLVTAEHGQEMRLDIHTGQPRKACCGKDIGHHIGCPTRQTQEQP